MLCRLFSSCGEQGLLFVPEHTGFRCWVSQSLEHRLSSYGTRAFSSTACGIFLDQRSNPWPPAFAGGFVTTEPPGNPCHWLLEFSFIFHCSEPASPFQGGIHALHLIYGSGLQAEVCLPPWAVPLPLYQQVFFASPWTFSRQLLFFGYQQYIFDRYKGAYKMGTITRYCFA